MVPGFQGVNHRKNKTMQMKGHLLRQIQSVIININIQIKELNLAFYNVAVAHVNLERKYVTF